MFTTSLGPELQLGALRILVLAIAGMLSKGQASTDLSGGSRALLPLQHGIVARSLKIMPRSQCIARNSLYPVQHRVLKRELRA